MRYVIVSVLKGKGGEFNNSLRKEVFKKFKARSSKLPAHFTIKAPFEYDGSILELENAISKYCNLNKKQNYKVEGFNHFDDRVIFMDVKMDKQCRMLHNTLIDELTKISFLKFSDIDGRNKKVHVTVASKKINKIFESLWAYISTLSCNFDEDFDNVTVYKWQGDTWVLHKEFKFKG